MPYFIEYDCATGFIIGTLRADQAPTAPPGHAIQALAENPEGAGGGVWDGHRIHWPPPTAGPSLHQQLKDLQQRVAQLEVTNRDSA